MLRGANQRSEVLEALIIHQVGCHRIDQVSRLIRGSFGGSIGQNAEVSIWNQGVYQH